MVYCTYIFKAKNENISKGHITPTYNKIKKKLQQLFHNNNIIILTILNTMTFN